MAQLFTPRMKRTYPRGTIACRRCGAPIRVYKLASLADEFSVQCPKCRDRGIYAKRALAIDELPERRRKPRD